MEKFWKIVKLLLYGWVLYVLFIIKILILRCKRNKKYKKIKQQQNADCACASVTTTVYKRPEPFIYDQYYLMQQGITGVTWDNPDIKIYPLGTVGQPYAPPPGAALSPETLQPGTEYVIAARVWNYATDAAALGVEVLLSYLSFGIGTVSHSIPDAPAVVNIGVNGDPHFCPAYAYMKWTTPKIGGHYCLQVKLNCNDDKNPNDNLGQLNTHVVAAQSPANFTFQLRNPDRKTHTYHFKSDAYALLKKDPCEKKDTRDGSKAEKKKEQIAYARARNDAALYPVPKGWTVAMDPEENILEGGEERTINVSIIPPDSFSGRQHINIHAFTEKGELTGGVTMYVTKQ